MADNPYMTPRRTDEGAEGNGPGSSAYRDLGRDPLQSEYNEYEIERTAENVTRPAEENTERQRELLESVARERETAEEAARFTGRAAADAERSRKLAQESATNANATRKKILQETNELLEQLAVIRENIKIQAETASRNAKLARTGAEAAERRAEAAKTEAQGQARNAEIAVGLAQSAVRRGQNTATKTKESARLAKEAGIQAKTSADASAESAAKAVKTVKELNTVVANYTESLKTYTENKDAELQERVNEQLAKITKEMDEIKSQMTKLAKEDKVTPALVASIQQSNKGIQENLNLSNSASTNIPTNSSEYTRGKMGISFIKFEGYTNILNPYARDPRNNNIINPILPVNLNVNLEGIDNFADVAPGNYLFVDNFQLRLSDFKRMNRNDFIQLILSPKNYIEFLEKLEQSSVERQFVDFRKKTKLSKEERKINKENAKIYAAKLFANEESFNIVFPGQGTRNGYYFKYIIMNHEIKKKNIIGPDAFRFDVKQERLQNNDTNKGYTFFTFKIKLILDSREDDEIKPRDFKAVDCKQRKARIYKIMGSLEGTKQIITNILGPEGAKKYLVDDTKMEELHGMAKPLPSSIRKYEQQRSMLDKLSFVSPVDRGDLPVSRRNAERALQRQRLSQRSLASSRFAPRMEGGKKTKRNINYKNKTNHIKKTKKRNINKKFHNSEKSKKLKNFKKNRKTKKL